MNPASLPTRRIREYAVDVATNRFVLWSAFILVHLWLGMVNLYSPTNPMGDVSWVYKGWIDQGLSASYWVGIDVPWVYPIVAIVPMLAANLFGSAAYPSTWLSMVLLLDAVALAMLTGWGRRGRNLAAGWWWVAFLLLLGPIAMSRIDAISVSLALIGMLLLAAHPIAASIVVTLAAWIKVWPAALVAAMVLALRERGTVIASAIAASVGVVIIAVAFGSGTNVLSFVTQQTGRGLQTEAPITTLYMWQAFFGVNGAAVYYDTDILSFQIMGNGVDSLSAIMTPVLGLAAVAVALVSIRAVRRTTDAATLLPVLALAFTTCLILFNKVGSPQFMSWLAVPVILGMIAAPGMRRRFRTPLVLVLLIGALTQPMYPFLYDELLTLNPVMLLILTARNGLIVAVFVWAVVTLWRAGSLPHADSEEPAALATSHPNGNL